MELANSRAGFRAVRPAVDDQGTHPADAFTAVMVKSDWFKTLLHQTLVYYIEHFQK
jgi:hypothetical protein